MVSTKREDVAHVRDRLRDPASSNGWNREAADMLDDLLAERDAAQAEVGRLRAALAPLAKIATFYDENRLDDEARRFWGGANGRQHENGRDPAEIELYTGRGGARLLTLADCFAARAALAGEPRHDH